MDEFEKDGRTPKFDHSTASRQLLAAACKSLSWSQDAWLKTLKDFAAKHGSVFGFRAIDKAPQQDFSEAVFTDSIEPRLKNLRWVFWVWLHVERPDTTAFLKTRMIAGRVNVLASAIHEHLTSLEKRNIHETPPSYGEQSLSRLKGKYLFYRRFYGDMKSIIVSRLECGADGDDANFVLTMKHDWIRRGTTETATGTIVPIGDSALFQGGLVGLGGPFIFFMTLLGLDSDGQVERGEGVLLAAAKGQIPSAYGTYMLREDNDKKLGVFEEKELAKDLSLWPLLKPVLARGEVTWKDKDKIDITDEIL